SIAAYGAAGDLPPFPTRRSSDLTPPACGHTGLSYLAAIRPTLSISLSPPRRHASTWTTSSAPDSMNCLNTIRFWQCSPEATPTRSEEHTSELQSRENLVCRLLLE